MNKCTIFEFAKDFTTVIRPGGVRFLLLHWFNKFLIDIIIHVL